MKERKLKPSLLSMTLTLISEYLVNVSCKKQADLDTQDVILTSPSMTETVFFFVFFFPRLNMIFPQICLQVYPSPAGSAIGRINPA